MTIEMKTGSLLSLVGGAVLGVLVAAGPAMAADMAPAYKAAAMPAPAYNWSGFYVGVTAGGGMASLPVTDMDDFAGFGAGFVPLTNTPSLKSGGAVGGLHAGYNWQFAPSFLVGIEGDFSWSSFKASDTTCQGGCNNRNVDRFVASSKLDSFSTLRARFGLSSDRTLVYVMAGPAWGHINASLTDFNCLNCANPGGVFGIANDSSFHLGIAVGAGVEYALTQNWILRGEYMHMDFGTKDAVFKDATGVLITPSPLDTFRARSTATAEIARLGISYKVW